MTNYYRRLLINRELRQVLIKKLQQALAHYMSTS